MIVQIPKRYKYLIGQISEEELLFVAYMHRIKKEFPDYSYFSIWTYDITVILGVLRQGITPAFLFQNLTKVFNVAFVSDNRLDISFKHWEPTEMDYELQDYRNIVVWSYILDQGNLAETDKNLPYHRYESIARPDIRYFVAALKGGFRRHQEKHKNHK